MSLNDTGQTQYNEPLLGNPSDIGPQAHTSYHDAKALQDAVKEQTFSQMASVKAMPKHYGKKITKDQYIPLLDDRNVNDQGIDAAGAIMTGGYTVTRTADSVQYDIDQSEVDTTTKAIDYVAATYGGAAADYTAVASTASGNLYGGSKDIGSIIDKFPLVGETGGRVNRVGNTRVQLSVELHKMGYFYEYTKGSLDFDTDVELYAHIARENIGAAVEISEDVLQIDLINGAGLIRFGGIATEDAEVTGEGSNPSLLTYKDFQRMDIDLGNANAPKKTTVITGSRMTDTKVVSSGRFMYCGSELVPTLTSIADTFGNPAFVGVEHYAGSGSVKDANMINGEIGKIGAFRIIQVQKMLHWAGAGAAATVANLGYRTTGGKYDIYPMLCISGESFTTVGFQTSKGAGAKFKIKHVKPESDQSYSQTDPFGETGFTSIKWWYATMILRPEWIGLAKTIAEI